MVGGRWSKINPCLLIGFAKISGGGCFLPETFPHHPAAAAAAGTSPGCGGFGLGDGESKAGRGRRAAAQRGSSV